MDDEMFSGIGLIPDFKHENTYGPKSATFTPYVNSNPNVVSNVNSNINSLSNVNPNQGNLNLNQMVAEPAQVMVMVPGDRAKKAEQSITYLKNLIVWIVLAFFGLVFLYVYFFLWKKTPYEGKTLPAIGIIEEEKESEEQHLMNLNFMNSKKDFHHSDLLKSKQNSNDANKNENDGPYHNIKNHTNNTNNDVNNKINNNVNNNLNPIEEIDVVKTYPPYPVYTEFDKEEIPEEEKRVSDTDAEMVKKLKARDDFMKEIEKVHSLNK